MISEYNHGNPSLFIDILLISKITLFNKFVTGLYVQQSLFILLELYISIYFVCSTLIAFLYCGCGVDGNTHF